MKTQQAAAILQAIGNPTLSLHWKQLHANQKEHLFKQLEKVDIPTLRLQQKLIHAPLTKNLRITPFSHFAKAGNQNDQRLGLKAISEGLVGGLIVAGGQGSRLRVEGPKGLCPVTKIKRKSLFQLLAEKTLAASKQAKRPLSLAIMTSPLNHEATCTFFKQHDFFGLASTQLNFFAQETLPLLDSNGNIFLETQDSLAIGPDGNGGVLHQFVRSEIWDRWHSAGIRFVNLTLIDNPLADPFDAELIGYQQRNKSDVVIKCTSRKDPEENVGVIVQENGKAAIIEYSEFTPEERHARNPDGTLLHQLANLSLFSFDMNFIKQIEKKQLPLHKAFKSVKFLNNQGKTILADKPMAWKFEKFIFDTLPFASKVDALLYPRETCFAPLKNFTGNDSFETVSLAIEKRDQQIIHNITGNDCTLTPLEIAQDFYYPTEELLKKWKGKTIDQCGFLES